MTQTVIGFFKDKDAAEQAASQLVHNGYSHDQIDVAAPDAAADTVVSDDRKHESGFKRFFKSLFGDTDEADRYTNVSHGYAMVTVVAASPAEAEAAADVMDEYGAVDINEQAAQQNPTTYGHAESDEQRYRDEEAEWRQPSDESSRDFTNEDRNLGRQRSRIFNSPVAGQPPARDEIQNPVEPATPEAFGPFKEGEIEITEHKEVPVIKKEARVVEEIKVAKEQRERTETIHDTVRETEVDIDRLPNGEHNSIRDVEERATGRNRKDANYNKEQNRDNIEKRSAKDRDRDTGGRSGDPLFGA